MFEVFEKSARRNRFDPGSAKIFGIMGDNLAGMGLEGGLFDYGIFKVVHGTVIHSEEKIIPVERHHFEKTEKKTEESPAFAFAGRRTLGEDIVDGIQAMTG